MTEILTSPKSTSVEESGAQEELVRALDDLLERYLHLLDRYQTLQQDLTKHLSAVRPSLYYSPSQVMGLIMSFVSGIFLPRRGQLQITEPHSLRPGFLR